MAGSERQGRHHAAAVTGESYLLLAAPDDPDAGTYCRDHVVTAAGIESARLRVLAGTAAAERRDGSTEPPESGVVVTVGDGTRSCSTRSVRGAESSPPAETFPARGNLRGVGATVDEYLSGWVESGYGAVLCVDSLTGLLEHAPVSDVYGFFFVLLHRAEDLGAAVHVHADPRAYDEEILRTFFQLFDRVITFEEGRAPPS